jgi:hypothetical protein
MARTYRRNARFARRHLDLQDNWARADIALGRKTYKFGPRQTNGWTPWELVTDNFGADSSKPYKRANIAEHTSSVRRFVKDTLAQGKEPIVLNERSRWYSGVGVAGTTVPIDGDDGDLFGPPDEDDDEPICPPNTLCGCGDIATIAIRFAPDDTRFYCYPCS